jgi:hypothetical protein
VFVDSEEKALVSVGCKMRGEKKIRREGQTINNK